MENALLMTFEHDKIDIQAGTETAVQLDLRNWGECRMTYCLLAGRVPENWAEINPGPIRVNAGGEVAVTVRVKVPSNAPVAHRTIIVHAIDPLTELECGHAMLKLQVNAS
jgi:uncharacterized membrane protein